MTPPTAPQTPAMAARPSSSVSQKPQTSDQQVALTPDGIHVSPLDERTYKYLELANGLHVLVVSDPETQSSSAAMDVHVGFHSDPEEIPGLAHFCEHMLFLGTEKYPDENSYSAFLTSHGGSSNAFTSARNTNYYFDVSTKHLHEALDRFAQFFITPRFTASATEREMNAVDSENKNYLQDDYWRINQAHRSLGNRSHPYHKFGVGNLETLRDTPKTQGLDVRDALLTYYDTFYSANMMKLVVYGKEDVDTLTQWVTQIFSGIRNNGRAGPPDFSQEPPFLESQLGRQLQVLPVKDMNIIGVTWLLPPVRGPRYTQQQTSVIAHLIGHEGEGSLLSLLKNGNWVTTISTGIEEEHADFALFLINFEATEEGMKHVDDIVAVLFQFLKLLVGSNSEESPALAPWMFQEMQDLAVMHFLFQSKQAPIHFTSGIAGNMQSLAKRDILSQDALFYPKEDAKQIQELVAHMTPQKMKLLVVGKSVESVVDQEERWYGTKYHESALDKDLLDKWSSVGFHEQLRLPLPNEFVASDFTLIDRNDPQAVASPLSQAPRRIRDDATCRVWFKPDVHFKKPKTHAALTLYSPFVNDSPLSYVLSDLAVACVQDELTEYSYDASLAGMHYDLAVQGNSIHLGAVGFSAKLDILVFRIVETLRALSETLEDELFARVYQQTRRVYENIKYDEAFRLATQHTGAIMQEGSWPLEELVTAVVQVEGNVALLKRHAKRMLEQIYVEALIYGNLFEPEALVLVENVLQRLFPLQQQQQAGATKVLPSQHTQWLPRQLMLPAGPHVESVLRCVHPNGDNLNCAIDCVFQIGIETPQDRVALAVFSQLVSEPLFNQLRTKEQLGYTVFSTPSRQSGIQWFRVIVQSNVAAPEYLNSRLNAFLKDMKIFIEHEMSDTQLQKYIQAIIKDYTEKPKSQEEEVHAISNEIAIREYHFDRRSKLAKLVSTITRQDVVAFFDTYISETAPKRKKLTVRIYGAPFALPSLESGGSGSGASAFTLAVQTSLVAAAAWLPSSFSGSPTSTMTPTQEIEVTDPTTFQQKQSFYPLPASARAAQQLKNEP